MSEKKEPKGRRKYTDEQKKAIIEELKTNTWKDTAKKHGIATPTLAKWRHIFALEKDPSHIQYDKQPKRKPKTPFVEHIQAKEDPPPLKQQQQGLIALVGSPEDIAKALSKWHK